MALDGSLDLSGELEVTLLTQMYVFNDLNALHIEINLRFYPYTTPQPEHRLFEWLNIQQTAVDLYHNGELWYDANRGGYTVSSDNPAYGEWPDGTVFAR